MFVLAAAPAPRDFSGTLSTAFSSEIIIVFFSFSGKDFLLSCGEDIVWHNFRSDVLHNVAFVV